MSDSGHAEPQPVRTTIEIITCMNSRLRWVLFAVSLGLAGCSDRQHDVIVQGIAFDHVKIDRRGFTIGLLARDTGIGGHLCKRGWVHLHLNGVLSAFTAAETERFGRVAIPAGTWIRQGEQGVITACALPRNLEVQGHWLRGTGGPMGVTTAFYSSGALKQFFPVRATRVDGVPCRAGLIHGWIELHENGRLKSGLLDEDLDRNGQHYLRGTRLEFDADGRVDAKFEHLVDWPAIGS